MSASNTLELHLLRQRIADHYLADETSTVRGCVDRAKISEAHRALIATEAAALIHTVRRQSKPSIMEAFLAEYPLSTKEGLALMCMAEALLRVPDADTVIALIEDKVGAGDWQSHIGQSASSLMNTASWGLLVASKLLHTNNEQGLLETLRQMTRRMASPVICKVALQVMKHMGRQFVLGRDIDEAQQQGAQWQSRGYTYSYDMLGEAARTEVDAERYFRAYQSALNSIALSAKSADIHFNPGVSVKLSALNCRYEWRQRQQVIAELVPRLKRLCLQAKHYNIGLNIDAEEADRLELSLDVIQAVLASPELTGWNGFGIVVQSYGPRASFVLDWIYALAKQYDRRVMVRLVKGAYWDTEIKRAQVLGLDGYPVFTRKVNTDVSYLACARQLLGMTDRIYPQFATHNAHTVAAILNMAENSATFEFQRLHGMGEALFRAVLSQQAVRCRIYAPVGEHRDLLAYLVRRLLENGANSSFVNKMADSEIAPEDIARDPFATIAALEDRIFNASVVKPADLFGGARRNALGWDISDRNQWQSIETDMAAFKSNQWRSAPMLANPSPAAQSTLKLGRSSSIYNPANSTDIVGVVVEATLADVDSAVNAAHIGFSSWSSRSPSDRGDLLRGVADLFEAHAPELIALLTREAGKTAIDAIGELREAIDFARFYALEGARVGGFGRGVVTCISPWNFPLAIFAGQIFANLAAGNVVIAKPAPQTPLIAARLVALMHAAGIPAAAVQLLPGGGGDIGASLAANARIDGVCFTGSTATAQSINRAMAASMAPDAPLIAETGGLNAMIVDATAQPEQVVAHVIESAFQSAGQRCSALRILYLQVDIAEQVITMLLDAMDALVLGDPWCLSTDIGPVIDQQAQQLINDYIEQCSGQGVVLKRTHVPDDVAKTGYFIAPTAIQVAGIEALDREIFGPVLHIATFEASELDAVVDAINAKGFGLTFGMHSRVDTRIAAVSARIRVGNIYINRNQIGAVVGSQPFGGEGLSGTGPKAGGYQYVPRLQASAPLMQAESVPADVDAAALRTAIGKVALLAVSGPAARRKQLRAAHLSFGELLDEDTVPMPGPTGELNQLSYHARGVVLCLGPTRELLLAQCAGALAQGNRVVMVSERATSAASALESAGLAIIAIDGALLPQALASVAGFDAVVSGAVLGLLRDYRIALAAREGAILPLITDPTQSARFVVERLICVDTTAAGGNVSLIASAE